MIDLGKYEVWFVPGSQTLYGEETLTKVAEHSRQIANELSNAPEIPVNVNCRPVMKDAANIQELCVEANRAENCVGIITWMHTFSPAQMWIPGLKLLRKPLLHLHTQFNRELPWSTIDMDFMNLNQSAHGDREFGFITSRMRLPRKVVAGYWQDQSVRNEIGTWARAACAWHDSQSLRVARFGDNMRQVAVTEGDKVEARIKFGYSVEGYGVGDLVDRIQKVSEADVDSVVAEYESSYTLAEPLRAGKAKREALRDAVRTEIGLRRFLDEGGFGAFTDTFEDLHGLSQLPGVGVQRLMADGYGFGGEGDWKTAALVRAMKVMSAGLKGGTSFMEDYTYHFKNGGRVLGAHMLEVCPSIAAAKPSLEIHPLSIGGKADPVRLVFDSQTGPAVVASVVDMGDRFRLVVNKVEVVPAEEPLPKLPVARALWRPEPDFKTASTGWILAGGAHHTGFSLALTAEHLEDFAEMAGIEFLLIDQNSTIRSIKHELNWNHAYFGGVAGRS
ncbi:MAG TPA: L-arabinose isomerase [Acidobacteriaceae bacterium]|jgi:L-arabinose isomerase|nr:L-arabinose isomerase [Acidobacteriaceae bacterium]